MRWLWDYCQYFPASAFWSKSRLRYNVAFERWLYLWPCKMPFFPDNYGPVLGFCPVPSPTGLDACIQLLLREWQLIKASGFCWHHSHCVISLQGSVLLALKPTATRALNTHTHTLTKLPLSSRDNPSDILLTETIVTSLTVRCCLSGPLCIPSPPNHNRRVKYSRPNYEASH